MEDPALHLPSAPSLLSSLRVCVCVLLDMCVCACECVCVCRQGLTLHPDEKRGAPSSDIILSFSHTHTQTHTHTGVEVIYCSLTEKEIVTPLRVKYTSSSFSIRL